MMRNSFYLAAGAILLAGCVSISGTQYPTDQIPAAVSTPPRAEKPAHVLRHVVLLKFKDGTTAEQRKQIESAFCKLPSEVDSIHDFEWGTDVSVENLQQGFTHCFVVTFRSEADRAKYLPHPAHKELGTLLGPHVDKVLVLDYWAEQSVLSHFR